MDDYELENARQWDDGLQHVPARAEPPDSEWQVVGPSKRRASKQPVQINQPPTHTPLQPRQRLPRQPQQRQPAAPQPSRTKVPTPTAAALAEAAWRERQEHTDALCMSAALALADNTFEKLAAENGAFIMYMPSLEAFGLWGERSDVAVAKRAILKWIDAETSTSGRSYKFSKICSLTNVLRTREENRWKREVKRNCYRKIPPPSKAFGAVGWFHWPVDEYRPETAFGMSCEALDPIRMKHKCYIRFANERSSFQVCGDSRAVQEALLDIRRTCYQLACRSATIAPVRAYLAHWRSESIPSHVLLEEYHMPAVISATGNGSKVVFSPRGMGNLDDQHQIRQEQTNSVLSEKRLSVQIANVLRKLKYHRANLELRVRLGTFILQNYQKPEDDLFDLQDYLAMTKPSEFRAHVTNEFGRKAVEDIMLRHLQQATTLLCPQGALTSELAHVRPEYSAVFVFEHEKSVVRLTMTWTESTDLNDQVQLSEPMKEWSRLESDSGRSTGRQTQLLDASLTDLHTGLAWAFELETAEVIDKARVPAILQRFSENVRINKSIMATPQMSQNAFVAFNSIVQLCEMRQAITWKFAVTGTEYTLELTHFQKREYPLRQSASRPAPETVYEPRWSLSVSRMHWQTMFSDNSRMTVGGMAEWSPEIENWFPKDWSEDSRNGFDQFVDKLVKIENKVKEIVIKDDEKGEEEGEEQDEEKEKIVNKEKISVEKEMLDEDKMADEKEKMAEREDEDEEGAW